jgi:hypothetical protein
MALHQAMGSTPDIFLCLAGLASLAARQNLFYGPSGCLVQLILGFI